MLTVKSLHIFPVNRVQRCSGGLSQGIDSLEKLAKYYFAILNNKADINKLAQTYL